MKKIENKKNNLRCYIGDFFEIAKELPQEYFQLVFTSPPYFVGKEYEEHDDTILERPKLYNFLEDTFKVLLSLTRPGGYIVFNLFDAINYFNYMLKEENGHDKYVKYESPHILMYEIMRKFTHFDQGKFCLNYIWDQKVEDTTAWGSFKSASAVRSRTNHEFIYGFQKKGESSSKGELSELSNEEWMEYTRSVISLNTEPQRSLHPTPFPVELPKYFIKFLTRLDDPVLDPFAGLCTTLEACRQLGREGWSVELSEKYVINSMRRFPKIWGKQKVRI